MPDWKQEITKQLAGLRLQPTRETEIVDELSQHLEDRYQELRANGVPAQEAYNAVLVELSDRQVLQRELKQVERTVRYEPVVLGVTRRRRNMPSDLWQDLRFGLRMLRKSPAFTLIAVFTLALGIGANTAIFSVVNGILLRPLPYKEPAQLAIIRVNWRGVTDRAGVAPAEVIDLRRETRLFEGFETINPNNASLTGDDMEKIPSATITEGLIPLLGIQPFLGNAVSQMEEGGQNQVWEVVISYELWQRRFGGDPEIIGRKIDVNNFRPMVVGVMPAGFRIYLGRDTNVPGQIDLFFLGSLTEDGMATDRSNHDFTTIARLKSGVTIEQAQSEIDALAADLAQRYPKAYENSNLNFHLVPLHQDLVRNARLAILALLGAVGFVLLIACANVANLILTRTDARAKEIAIRCALGAGRARIIGQLVTENLLLCLIAGACGLLIADQGIQALMFLRPANLPRLEGVGIDGTVMGVTLLVSLLAGVVLGVIPAWQAMRADVNETLKEGARRSSGRPGKMLNGLVVAEVALSLILLVGASLMIRTFVNLNHYDWGFNPDHLLTLKVNISPRRFKDPNSRWQFYQLAQEKVRALPGVSAVSGVTPLPLGGGGDVTAYALDETEAEPLSALRHTVLPDYFDTMGIRWLAGRDFTPRDIDQNLPVVIIDEKLAKQAWPNENPIGKKLLGRPRTKQQQWIEVIGVVGHVTADGFRDDSKPQVYVPYVNYPLFDLTLVVRGHTDLLPLATTIKKEVEALGTQRPVHTFRGMSAYVADQMAETRFVLSLMGILAVIALSLCLVGLYSVIAYSVSRRTNEIGIRMALGAQSRDVLTLILRQGLSLTFAGVGVGLAGAFALTRVIASLLFGVSATDLTTFIGVSFVLTAVALWACYVPARRATRVDPMIALRHE